LRGCLEDLLDLIESPVVFVSFVQRVTSIHVVVGFVVLSWQMTVIQREGDLPLYTQPHPGILLLPFHHVVTILPNIKVSLHLTR
jgi:hypothetical protein